MALPVLQALLLADHVYQDRITSKIVICGVFNTVFFNPPQAPTEVVEVEGNEQVTTTIAKLLRAGSPYAYFSLTELQGEKEFELRYVDLSAETDSENSVLLSIALRLACPDPLRTIELIQPLPPLPMSRPEEGVYALELLCENTLLGSHRVLLRPNPHT